ncbi:AraC family transcriptional regulator [Streptosporangium sp. NBC_01639]|uniref:AraC family transcriptional regulator n=1 Tax=Streptosporangium sp. NBC_01639 TaxID=2975948 RepID=UPI00386E2832|nr:AraC family transcriptional regulator [Streptosporangium sp. NBC_01639]
MYTLTMDVLSDAVTAMRVGRPHSTCHRLYAPWGMGFPPIEGGGFHIVLQGSCWLIPPRPDPPLALSAGDVVFIRGRHSHGLADSPSTPLTALESLTGETPFGRVRGEGSGAAATLLCGAYMLDQSKAHPLMSHVPQIVHLPAQVGRHPSLRTAVELLGSELARPQPGAGAVIPALLDTLLLYILRAWMERESRHGRTTGWIAALNDSSIAAALTAIHQDPAHPWTVEELGTRAGLSRAAFARRFTALIGQPPLTYLTWWRMTTAARLLRESDAPLRIIAAQAGYSSEIAFAAAFKRQYGLTPGRYRHRPGTSAGEANRFPAVRRPSAAPAPLSSP